MFRKMAASVSNKATDGAHATVVLNLCIIENAGTGGSGGFWLP